MSITGIKVKLEGEDGNAYAIMGRVRAALKRGGRSDLVDEYTKKATSGNYDHLLQVTMEYVDDGDEEVLGASVGVGIRDQGQPPRLLRRSEVAYVPCVLQ